jgi:hypothetical protein
LRRDEDPAAGDARLASFGAAALPTLRTYVPD